MIIHHTGKSCWPFSRNMDLEQENKMFGGAYVIIRFILEKSIIQT
ncbi:hypothetical protein Psch_04088 [Pelotomaculum schinkii]|uniref:Uncharacterized protein n=1 Tax=Pelotomaculum schinkii TaxID=78350 RepID=A0A4Y7R6U1_9FIRM|nr:hypothetical protein Psch_04088 [Pelotomaculum schinkii]